MASVCRKAPEKTLMRVVERFCVSLPKPERKFFKEKKLSFPLKADRN